MRFEVTGENLKEKFRNYIQSKYHEEWYEEENSIIGYTPNKEITVSAVGAGQSAFYLHIILTSETRAIVRHGVIGGSFWDIHRLNRLKRPKQREEILKWCDKWDITLIDKDL